MSKASAKIGKKSEGGMKNFALMLILLLGVGLAGELKSAPDFALKMLSELSVKEFPCPPEFKEVADNGYLCGFYPDMPTSSIKAIWDLKAKSVAESLGYTYKVAPPSWSYSKSIGDTLVFALNNDVHVLALINTIGVGLNFIVFSSPNGYGDLPITALPSGQSGLPQTSAFGFPLEVKRYLCNPSVNGRARVLGTVKNTSSKILEFVRVNVEFFNGSRFVGQDSSFIQATKLAANAESTFELFAQTPLYTRCEISFEDSTGKLPTKFP
jgi:hypothetical protein